MKVLAVVVALLTGICAASNPLLAQNSYEPGGYLVRPDELTIDAPPPSPSMTPAERRRQQELDAESDVEVTGAQGNAPEQQGRQRQNTGAQQQTAPGDYRRNANSRQSGQGEYRRNPNAQRSGEGEYRRGVSQSQGERQSESRRGANQQEAEAEQRRNPEQSRQSQTSRRTRSTHRSSTQETTYRGSAPDWIPPIPLRRPAMADLAVAAADPAASLTDAGTSLVPAEAPGPSAAVPATSEPEAAGSPAADASAQESPEAPGETASQPSDARPAPAPETPAGPAAVIAEPQQAAIGDVPPALPEPPAAEPAESASPEAPAAAPSAPPPDAAEAKSDNAAPAASNVNAEPPAAAPTETAAPVPPEPKPAAEPAGSAQTAAPPAPEAAAPASASMTPPETATARPAPSAPEPAPAEAQAVGPASAGETPPVQSADTQAPSAPEPAPAQAQTAGPAGASETPPVQSADTQAPSASDPAPAEAQAAAPAGPAVTSAASPPETAPAQAAPSAPETPPAEAQLAEPAREEIKGENPATPATVTAQLALARPARAAAAVAPAVPQTPAPQLSASLDRMIGQMLVVGFRGLRPDETWPQKLTAQIKAGQIGGVLFMSHNIESPQQVKALTGLFQKTKSDIPLLLTIDQEGGIVQRLSPEKGFQEYPTATKIGRSNDPLTAYSAYRRMAGELAQHGFNLNFGPVVDLHRNDASAIIAGKERSFGAPPKHVAAFAKAFIMAHQDEGVLTVLKHFPGHGSTPLDTHVELPDVSASWTKAELEPYRDLIASRSAQAVMVGHIAHPTLLGEPNLPASLSRKAIRTILRGDLAFNGVVISDDLEMGALRKRYSLEESAVKAVQAGTDIILLSNQNAPDPDLPQKIVAAIKKAVAAGTISRDELQASYDRILALKQKLQQVSSAKAGGAAKRAGAERAAANASSEREKSATPAAR